MRNFFFFCIVFLAFCGFASLGLSNQTKTSSTPEMEKVENSMAQVNDQIIAVRKDIEKSNGEMKKDLEAKFKSIEEAQEDVEERFNKLKNSSGRAWKEVEKGFNGAMLKLKDSLEKVQKELQR